MTLHRDIQPSLSLPPPAPLVPTASACTRGRLLLRRLAAAARSAATAAAAAARCSARYAA